MTSADLSIITLVMNASVVVKCVMGILLIASLSSWATIFSKMLVLSRSRRQTDDFESAFGQALISPSSTRQQARARSAPALRNVCSWPA